MDKLAERHDSRECGATHRYSTSRGDLPRGIKVEFWYTAKCTLHHSHVIEGRGADHWDGDSEIGWWEGPQAQAKRITARDRSIVHGWD